MSAAGSAEVQFTERPGGERLAFRQVEGAGPTLVFLPGYKSDMAGSKATMLFDRAADAGRAALLFDYAGCGASGGAFEDQTLESFLADTLHVIGERTQGALILVGSSMGGWLMLLAALALGPRVAGIVGIAAAPDFTRWGFTPEQVAQFERGETVYEANEYGPEPTPTTAAFWRSGEANLLLDGPIAIDCPVRLLHGQCDADVPHPISLKLAAALRSDDVQTVLVKNGDHRLSRESDLRLLAATVDRLYEDIAAS